MKRVGEVVRVAQGLAVARCPDESHPEIGTPVVDEQLTTVGRVVDVFGPVARPHVAIDARESPATLLGTRLYTE